jgi:hypothetical protein
MLTSRSDPTVVPEIDHCIGEGFECIVHLTEPIEGGWIDAVAICAADLDVIHHGASTLVMGGLPFNKN